MKNLSFLLVIVLFPLLINSCEEETALIDSQNKNGFEEAEIESEIKSNYYSWARASKNEDVATMYRLSNPGGNFEGMTRNCTDSWEMGNTLYYEFSSLTVLYLEEEYAEIEGIIDMIQGDGNNYKSSFRSSVTLYDGDWLLDGMNAFHTYQLIEVY